MITALSETSTTHPPQLAWKWWINTGKSALFEISLIKLMAVSAWRYLNICIIILSKVPHFGIIYVDIDYFWRHWKMWHCILAHSIAKPIIGYMETLIWYVTSVFNKMVYFQLREAYILSNYGCWRSKIKLNKKVKIILKNPIKIIQKSVAYKNVDLQIYRIVI